VRWLCPGAVLHPPGELEAESLSARMARTPLSLGRAAPRVAVGAPSTCERLVERRIFSTPAARDSSPKHRPTGAPVNLLSRSQRFPPDRGKGSGGGADAITGPFPGGALHGPAHVWLVLPADAPRAPVAGAFLPAFDDEDITCLQSVLVLLIIAGSLAALFVRFRDVASHSHSSLPGSLRVVSPSIAFSKGQLSCIMIRTVAPLAL